MKISTQIRALLLLLLMVSVWSGYSFWETSKNLDNRRAVNEVVQNMIKATFEFNILINEHIASASARTKMQWNNRHTSLEALLLKAEDLLTYSDDKSSLKKIIANETQAETLFYRLEELDSNNQNKPLKADVKKRTQIISQIQLRIQGMLSEASRMSRRSLERLIASEERLEITTASLLFILWPIFIVSFYLMERKVIKPITNLQKSAKQLSSGNYDTRIAVVGKNEVSALAKAYNQLAADIQKKINTLTDKTNRLNKSQDELLNLNENLHQMVDEQTAGLRNSESRQRAILESMHDCVITLDEKFNIKNINHAVENMFGYSEEEILGKNIGFLVSHMPGNKSFTDDYLEGLGNHKQAGSFPIEMSLNEMEIDNTSMYTGIIRDNTERKRADKLKTEFVSTVSHELRTPLTAIRGSLGLVTGGVLGEIPEKALEMLTTASRNTDRLLNLINDLLDIQKIEAGKMDFHYVQTNLMNIIEKSVTDNIDYAKQYNVDIQIGNKTDDIVVRVDPHRLSQIMANLLSNAAKFSPKNGDVIIHSSIQDGYAKVSVADQGEGIPAQFHDKIFSKFSQNDSSDTRQKGGTGLGLSITKQMIETMGGYIDFTSKIGEGTTFNIHIPLEKNSPAE